LKKPLQLFQLFSLIFITGFFSCEEPVDLNIDEVFVPQVVVNGSFTTHHPFQIVLTRSGNILNGTTQFIEDAKISIAQEGTMLGVLNYQEDALLPFYTLKGSQPTIATDYHLTIEVPNFTTLTATDQIPKPVPLKAIAVDSVLTREGNPISSVILSTHFKDPSEKTNFYHLRLFQEAISGRTQSSGFVGSRDENLLPLPIEAILENMPNATFDSDQLGILFSDELIDGQSVQLKLSAKINQLEAGMFPEIVGELRTVSENYYQYYTSLARQQESKDRPFTEPVSVFSNIENGLGIFAGFSTYRDSVTITQ